MITRKINSIHLFIVVSILLMCCASPINKQMTEPYTEDEMILEESTKEEQNDRISLDYEFENETLSESNLTAFEQRAIQKINDAVGYFEIISDKNFDPYFKEQAKTMVYQFFEYRNTSLSFNKEEISLENLVERLEQSEYGKLIIKVKHVKVKKPVQKDNNRYKGQIEFIQIISAIQGQNKTLLDSCSIQMNIVVKKVDKKFGETSKMIWEALLGSSYEE